MTNAIAIWNYCWEPSGLPDWISEFAVHGFETISFNPGQFAGDALEHLPAAVDALREHDLTATVHGSVKMETPMMESLIQAMGDRLRAFTMDSAMCEDSRGRLHDAGRIAGALSFLQDLTKGTGIWLAIEDFPLDAFALEHFQGGLGKVYEHPRTGILIDVGHMHMRLHGSAYFSELSVVEYFERLPCPLVEVHLHDNNGKKDQHGHFGFGTVPFDEVASALKSIEFAGVCTIEIAPRFHCSTPEESKGKAVESLHSWRALME